MRACLPGYRVPFNVDLTFVLSVQLVQQAAALFSIGECMNARMDLQKSKSVDVGSSEFVNDNAVM